MSVDFISIVERTDYRLHRSKIIIHKAGGFYFAEFATVEQLDFFAQTMGFTYTLREERENERYGLWQIFDIDRKINDPCNGGFWKLADLPEGARPIKALSNGSIVTCYFTNDGETITMYRPNPNSKEVYNPLPLDLHLAHQKIYGSC